MVRRVATFSLSLAAILAVYVGCQQEQDDSTDKSYRDVVEVRQCTVGDRYYVRCHDGSVEYRSYEDIQTDNVCLAKQLMTVVQPGGTFLGRVETGTNCHLSYNQQVLLKQPSTFISAAQALVMPVEGSISGCNITAGVVLRSDVEFSTPSYPSYPSFPNTPSYPCD